LCIVSAKGPADAGHGMGKLSLKTANPSNEDQKMKIPLSRCCYVLVPYSLLKDFMSCEEAEFTVFFPENVFVPYINNSWNSDV